ASVYVMEYKTMKISDRRIHVWGDSVLKGIVLDEKKEIYRVFEDNSVARFGTATGSRIVNHSSFGMTTGKALERIERSLVRNPLEDGDIVLVEFGGNDCDYVWSSVSENPDGAHLPKTPLDSFRNLMQSIIGLFRGNGISPVLMTLPPLEPNRYLDWISRGLDRMNILRWLGDVNKIYRWQEAYNDAVVDIARENSLRLIDVRKNFLVSSRYSELLCADGIHPSPDGHDEMFGAFMNYVEAI
ncbi:MAG TPA: SGNH/GDSL hydrolase family protein, partial [Treponemataceae bacterium]|nr:SGNH/GDSL hydrolase family protein [Treponemataceae bacterium]